MKVTRRVLTPREAFVVLAKGFLFMALMFWALWAVAREASDRRLEKALEILNDGGYATCLQDLAPPRVPPEENAALFYTAAFSAFRSLRLSGGYWTEELSEADPEERAEITRDLDRASEVFGLLRHARRLTKCRFKRDYARGINVDFPEVSEALALAPLVSYYAQWQADDDRPEEARETVRDLFALAEAFRDEPIFSTQSIRYLLITSALRTLADCSRRSTTEGELRAWQEVLPKPTILDGSVELAARGDLAAVACFLTQPSKLRLCWSDDLENQIVGRVFDPLITWCSIDGLLHQRRTIELCDLSYPAVQPQRRSKLDFASYVQRPVGHLVERRAILQTAFALTRAALEAERTFIQWGRFPDKIEETDVWSGRPFVVDLEEGLIRSTGPRPMDLVQLDYEGLVWRLQPR